MQDQEFELLIKREFLAEAGELLDELEQAFLDLEQNPNSRDIVARIFRMAHTLKGSGAAAGFNALSRFAHEFEAALVLVRDGKVAASPVVVDVLLRAGDLLRGWCDRLTGDHGAAAPDTSVLSRELAAISASVTTAAAPAQAPAANAASGTGSPQSAGDRPLTADARPLESKMRVLVVDDDTSVRSLIAAILEELPVEIVEADSGRTGLDLIRSTPIDLIVTDLKMPDVDGHTFTRQVRDLNLHLPVILVTGYADKDVLIDFVRLGVYGVLEKPFLPHSLLAMVRGGLRAKQLHDTLSRLVSLNFRSYVGTMRLLAGMEAAANPEAQAIQADIAANLEEIRQLTQRFVGGNGGIGGDKTAAAEGHPADGQPKDRTMTSTNHLNRGAA